MRRFEFVEGTSSKFWSVEVDNRTLAVVYGRIGTSGSRKEKLFATAEAAQREHDKKVAEKLKEGYSEVGGAVTPAAVKIPAKPLAPRLPPRWGSVVSPSGRQSGVTQARVALAAEALNQLESELGGRSWRVARLTHRATAALRTLGMPALGAVAALGPVFTALMDSVLAPKGSRRLPLELAIELLYELDASALVFCLARWKNPPASSPTYAAITALHGFSGAIRDPEMLLRAARLLVARPDFGACSEPAWARRWSSLREHINGDLAASGASIATVLGALDAQHDPHLARRLTLMSTQ